MACVLVVEDESIVALDIEQTLAASGHTVPATAATGEEAIRMAAETRPDLILMDIRLRGEMDGIEAALRIRHDADVPVVFLTANADVDTIARAKLVQPFGYVVKPFNERELRSAITVALYRHAMERQLRDRQRWFATTLRSIGDAVIATDTGLKVSFMNPVAERLTGWTAGEAIGRDLREVHAPRDERTRAELESPATHARAGATPDTAALLVTRDGREVPIEQSAAPITADDGALLGVVLVFRDVTERRKLEDRLSTSARLASLGTLIAGAAHEINNPLTYNLANLTFARRTIPELVAQARALVQDATSERWRRIEQGFTEIVEALAEASEGGERVKRLVVDLKAFSRPVVQARDRVDLGAVVETAVRIVGNELRHRARIEQKIEPVPPVFGNVRQLEQVVTNLLLNAVQAIEGDVAENRIRISLVAEARDVVLEVEDTGVGMTQEVLARMFDPFFTTKPVGTGTGLGLAISHRIVQAHGGELSAVSTPGRGSTFRMKLPVVSVEPAAPDPPPRPTRVLVIDDEPWVGRAVRRAIGARHEVVLAASAEDALAMVQGDPAFDVVISDLMMPGMSGMELYEKIQASTPERAEGFLFFTGGAFTPRARTFVERMAGRVMEKPFDVEVLASLVEARVNARKR